MKKYTFTILFFASLVFASNVFAQKETKQLSGKISIDKLPNTIKPFVNEHYKGYKIKSASYDPLCSGKDAIDVIVTKANSKIYSLIFLLDGTFIQQEVDIPFAEAPQKVRETLELKYPNYTYSKQIEKLEMADKTIQYLVDITKSKISKEVIINENGQVVCEN